MRFSIVVGKLLVATYRNDAISQLKSKFSLIIFFTFMIFSFIVASYYFYLNYRVFEPFRKLKSFAVNIASGNLETPLFMDSNNLFGLFTESFDLMRDKILEAKQAEALANRSKKELVPSLSHDIKTPVTSIKLICELLQVTTKEEMVKEKLHTIYIKADQIDHLVNNLFQASLEELGELKVTISENKSYLLETIIHNIDYYGKISHPKPPGYLIQADSMRLEQVFEIIPINTPIPLLQ